MQKVVVIGAGGLGREVADIPSQSPTPTQEIVGFIDENPAKIGQKLNGRPVLGTFEWFQTEEAEDVYAVIAIGNNYARKKVAEKAEKYGVKFTNIIHHNVSIGSNVELGVGVVLCQGNTVTANAKLGNHVFVNMHCTVAHDDVLEDYVNLSPGVHISGNCVLKEGCHLFTNSSVIPGIIIGEWAEAGAGAVVLESVDAYAVVVGVPAKTVKFRDRL